MAQATGVHAHVEFLDSEQVRQAIEADFSVEPAVALPESVRQQLGAGNWIYVPGYTARGPVCLSWGRRQQSSWALPDEYCERGAVAVETDGWTTMVTEEARMNAFLARIPADC